MTDGMSRLHALDGLRAVMMLLGLVLHSAANYTVTPLGEAWPYQDAQTSRLFDFLVFIVHLFRMPTFFVIAGFFAAFLYVREGGRGFLRHRARRILLPLVAAWLVTAPLVGAGFFFAHARQSGWDAAVALMNGASANNTGGASLMHLWFLYYLSIFYVVCAATAPLLRRLPDRLHAAVDRAFGALVPGLASLVLLSGLTTLTLMPMAAPALETSVAFLPAIRVLAAYFVFFGFGWLLFHRRDRVPAFAARPWLSFGASMGSSIVYMSIVLNESLPRHVWHVGGIVTAGFATWLFVFAWIGIFVRYFESPRPLQRYLADGSYWIYLIHLPFTIAIPAVLAPYPVPALAKFLVTLGGTTLVTVVTYHYLVRSTWIGAFLNGRRYPRTPPWVTPGMAPRALSAGPSGGA
jgi:peptidoglycan/LPS O-acetylase OafA/YrhL